MTMNMALYYPRYCLTKFEYAYIVSLCTFRECILDEREPNADEGKLLVTDDNVDRSSQE